MNTGFIFCSEKKERDLFLDVKKGDKMGGCLIKEIDECECGYYNSGTWGASSIDDEFWGPFDSESTQLVMASLMRFREGPPSAMRIRVQEELEQISDEDNAEDLLHFLEDLGDLLPNHETLLQPFLF